MLVDTNVLIDILSVDGSRRSSAADAIQKLLVSGPVTINEIVYAELSGQYPSQNHLDAAVEGLQLDFEWLPKSALYLAGQAFRTYRRAGGPRNSILPDFFIGAHAAVVKMPILTRDARRYRSYFPASKSSHPNRHANGVAAAAVRQRVSFLYFTRCGMMLSWPSRRILSFS